LRSVVATEQTQIFSHLVIAVCEPALSERILRLPLQFQNEPGGTHARGGFYSEY